MSVNPARRALVIKVSKALFIVLAWLFLLGLIIQTFLAGSAVFIDPIYWEKHTSFIHWAELIPVLMLLTSYTGQLPRSFRWQSLGLLILILLQYATANIPYAGAVHPVFAMFLFWQAAVVIRKSLELHRIDRRKPKHAGTRMM